VDVRERRPFEIRRKLLEVLVALTREPDDHIRADRRVGYTRANGLHERGVLRDGVRPPHGREHSIAGVLQGKMKMRRETIGPRHEIDELGRAVHRLERADAKQDAHFRQGVQQLDERGSRREVATIGAKVHARDGDFLETR